MQTSSKVGVLTWITLSFFLLGPGHPASVVAQPAGAKSIKPTYPNASLVANEVSEATSSLAYSRSQRKEPSVVALSSSDANEDKAGSNGVLTQAINGSEKRQFSDMKTLSSSSKNNGYAAERERNTLTQFSPSISAARGYRFFLEKHSKGSSDEMKDDKTTDSSLNQVDDEFDMEPAGEHDEIEDSKEKSNEKVAKKERLKVAEEKESPAEEEKKGRSKTEIAKTAGKKVINALSNAKDRFSLDSISKAVSRSAGEIGKAAKAVDDTNKSVSQVRKNATTLKNSINETAAILSGKEYSSKGKLNGLEDIIEEKITSGDGLQVKPFLGGIIAVGILFYFLL